MTFSVTLKARPKMIPVTKLPPAEQDVFFQEEQFDPDLRIGHKPQGTSHISRQGSETNDQPANRPVQEEYLHPSDE
jgi:hypothetical protein